MNRHPTPATTWLYELAFVTIAFSCVRSPVSSRNAAAVERRCREKDTLNVMFTQPKAVNPGSSRVLVPDWVLRRSPRTLTNPKRIRRAFPKKAAEPTGKPSCIWCDIRL